MKFIFKYLKFSFLTIFLLNLISCVKSKEVTNLSSDLIDSPVGYWATQDSQLGQIGWKIESDKFKKCIIALDTKITEKVGSIKVDGHEIYYVETNANLGSTATYHPDTNTLTEDQGVHLKYYRANDEKISELNRKGCHL